MTMPGFSAEASVYKGRTYYQSAVGPSQNGGITLQQLAPLLPGPVGCWPPKCPASGSRLCCWQSRFGYHCDRVPCFVDPCENCRTPAECCACAGGIWTRWGCSTVT